MPFENPRRLMATAILAGRILMENNAETYRVEETITHILSVGHFESVEVLAIGSGLIVTIDDPSISSLTKVKRLRKLETNLSKINQVNRISRLLAEGELTVNEAYLKLLQTDMKSLSDRVKDFGLLAMIGGFAMFFSGQINEALVAVPSGLWLLLVNRISRRLHINEFISNVLAVTLMSTSIILLRYFLPFQFDEGLAIVGIIMPLVPGTAITNAIRDTLRQDYLSGSTRMAGAFVTALSVAIGVALAFFLTKGVV
ncbi:threonine/serine exporter [Atopobacter sp. AH10]|uniref:threonine/serine exporter family protein n=1 Tax=Atopobacter sp. AH10 TaxID=2315861 RepID=UPI000EF260EE|nr:threonine/serine exporter family protein [Atopobacter sp. AH10]RLK62864.1 threonine/serine exporter [Atopobacter sp. AH10]